MALGKGRYYGGAGTTFGTIKPGPSLASSCMGRKEHLVPGPKKDQGRWGLFQIYYLDLI